MSHKPLHRALCFSGLSLQCLLAVLVAGLLLAVRSQPARAQSNAACQQVVNYLDLNQDGSPDAMVLACQFAPGTHDQLTIYKAFGKTAASLPWQQNITYQAETWVFDHGTQGKASLIINFHKDGSALMADLYDDRNQDGQVSYTVSGSKVSITENKYWTVRVIAAEGWWVKDGIPNYNLHILIDGDVEGMFMMEGYRKSLKTDGQPDYDIQIYDQNHNGKPELDKRMELTPWLQGSVGLGTQMMANWVDDELPFSGGFDLWPYLDLAHPTPKSGSRVNKGGFKVPIMFEPATGRIEAVGEFVASRGSDHNCFYYSAIPWKEKQVNETDFESPFCFYDLAQDGDHIPELQVRAVYWPPHDPPFLGGTVKTPYELIRYSWDQENSQTWRYAVGLVGQHLEDSPVNFADIVVKTIPYNQFPAWVTSHTWDMAVFDEFTGASYFNSEGDYNVSYPEDNRFAQYFTGQSVSMPSPEIIPAVNFKMEWAMNYYKQPTLYFSAVDHRLHLLGASGGAWTMDPAHSMTYQNLGGGDLINRWTYLANGQLEKSLILLGKTLLLTENDTLMLRFSDAPQSLFSTLPPTNHAEWVKLGADLAKNKPTFAADDFQAMANQFGAAASTVQGASLRDLRVIPGGFRFILTLKSGFSLSGEDPLGVKGKASGDYAVSYDVAAFHVQPLTPPDLRISSPVSSSPEDLPVQYVRQDFQAMLRNTGLEDAQTVEVRAEFQGPGQKIIRAAPQKVSVPAGESLAVRIPWAPTVPGAWQVRVTAQVMHAQGQGGSLFSAVLPVQVAPAPQITVWSALSAFGLVPGWAVLLLLAAIAAVAGALGWSLLRGNPS